MSQLSDAVHCAYDKGYERGYLKGKNDGDRDIAMLQTRLYKTSESMSKAMMFETGKPIAVIHSDNGQAEFNLGYEQGKKDAVVHGRWIEKIEKTRTFEEVDVQTSIECSVCGRRYWDTPGYDIDNGVCPPSCLCGAKMDAQEGAELN